MTYFIRLTDSPVERKSIDLVDAIRNKSERFIERDFSLFKASPNSAFSYWLPESILKYFKEFAPFEVGNRTTKCGMGTLDDFRFLRLSWEINPNNYWKPFVKGGSFSPWYSEIYMRVNWKNQGQEVKQFVTEKVGSATRKIQAQGYYFRPGLTFPRRPANTGWFSIVPNGCIFSDNGPMAFVEEARLFHWMAFLSASVPHYLMQSLMNRGQEGSGASLTYEVGIVAKVPIPPGDLPAKLASLAEEAFELAQERYASDELSSLFCHPRRREDAGRDVEIVYRLYEIQVEIDTIVAGFYRISATDLIEVNRWISRGDVALQEEEADNEEAEGIIDFASETELYSALSWIVGVVFGRFDLQLYTGERAAKPRPKLLDPLPANSPGMLPDGYDSFHNNAGILVDDPGHKHDIVRLIEEVLVRVEIAGPSNVRRWLQREFFPFHLLRHSKSRRKAPIYWPLSTTSGSYTLWLYYPSLTSQTLYTAINDFVEPSAQTQQSLRGSQQTGQARPECRRPRRERNQEDALRIAKDPAPY
jgi:hypothetical protein